MTTTTRASGRAPRRTVAQTPPPPQIDVRGTTSYTVKEIAEYLQCSRRTVERMIADGDLKIFHPRANGRMIRITSEALQEYLAKSA